MHGEMNNYWLIDLPSYIEHLVEWYIKPCIHMEDWLIDITLKCKLENEIKKWFNIQMTFTIKSGHLSWYYLSCYRTIILCIIGRTSWYIQRSLDIKKYKI